MKTKANIGIALVVSFLITLILGVILHFKSHGILIQSRGMLKTVHWVFGYATTVLLFIHWTEFRKVLSAMRKRIGWFSADTWLLIVLFLAT